MVEEVAGGIVTVSPAAYIDMHGRANPECIFSYALSGAETVDNNQAGNKTLENFATIAAEYVFLLKLTAAAVAVLIAGFFLRKRPEPS